LYREEFNRLLALQEISASAWRWFW